MPNELIHETSPYLLQHAHNPVNWQAWNDANLQKAKAENKLLIISIGYSACHWCHVMEHESFEDEQVAAAMNKNFICIKVDREERPDIDQVYMQAVQLMTGHGGWPLNCFALPDGRPLYGGTYFPKQQWLSVVLQVAGLWNKDPEQCKKYADELVNGIKNADVVKLQKSGKKDSYTISDLHAIYKTWSVTFDNKEGGPDRAPKFPLPNNYEFLLRYAWQAENNECLEHVLLTLDKMAYGGIYDHIGGGFARYSTDKLWKVPHFEKMLYDNAQLASLYSQAYQLTKKELYKSVVFETLQFIERELTSPSGGFYSALDADSEGEEGKFYIWKKEELEKLLEDKSNLFFDFYNVNSLGYWENGNYILLRNESDEQVAERNNLSTGELQQEIDNCKKPLLTARQKRIRPGLDDKILTSWNALMIKGYADAYSAFAEKKYLDVAINHGRFIIEKLSRPDGSLYHNYKAGKATINGFLEDYCFIIEAFISLYQATLDEQWILKAEQLLKYVFIHFQEQASGMFYFTSDTDSPLITRKMETEDNVIPASNSSMAKSLFLLGHYFENDEYIKQAKKMAASVKEFLLRYPSSFSNWGLLLLNQLYSFYEIAITGNDSGEKATAISSNYIPNKLIAATEFDSQLPLLKNRVDKNKTLIYVCVDKHCLLPVENVEEAIKQIKRN